MNGGKEQKKRTSLRLLKYLNNVLNFFVSFNITCLNSSFDNSLITYGYITYVIHSTLLFSQYMRKSFSNVKLPPLLIFDASIIILIYINVHIFIKNTFIRY